MKILIPYDGSKNAEKALRDLSEAGLAGGDRHEVLIVVSDVWLTESVEEFFSACAARRRKVEISGACSYISAQRRLEEERFLSREASERLSSMFPSWDARVETLPGMSLASSEVLERAETWGADLIILGSGETGAAAQTFSQGTGAARVAKEAACAVRVAGGRNALQINVRQTKEKKIKEEIPRPEFEVSKAAAIG